MDPSVIDSKARNGVALGVGFAVGGEELPMEQSRDLFLQELQLFNIFRSELGMETKHSKTKFADVRNSSK